MHHLRQNSIPQPSLHQSEHWLEQEIAQWTNSEVTTVYMHRYVARVDKSHPLIALSSQFSVTDPLISRMVDSLAADITFSQFIEISTIK